MKKQEIASVSKGGFAFCRIGVAVLIWLAFIFRIKELVVLTFLILLFSALMTVKNAPMIKLWDWTFGLFIKTKKEFLNVKAMRFAHTMGTVLAGICVLLVYVFNSWTLVFLFALIKTISSFGFCPASKVYNCMSDGTCCAFSRKMKKLRERNK